MASSVMVGTVLADELLTRDGPGYSYPIISGIVWEKGDTFEILETAADGNRTWGKHDYGWSLMSAGSNKYVSYKYVKSTISLMSIVDDTSAADDSTSTSTTASDTGTTISTAQITSIFNSMFSSSVSSGSTVKKSMRLFGIPYQFIEQADPRVEEISEVVGRTYMENIVMNAPVVTMMPGKPVYLPGNSNKQGTGAAIIQAANGNFEELQSILGSSTTETLRYYDFQSAYTEYMKYVNVMCRAAATFLELDDELDGTALQRYDWRNYRWTASSYQTMTQQLVTSAVSTTSSFASNLVSGIVDKIATYGSSVLDYVTGTSSSDHTYNSVTTSTTDEEDEAMDTVLQNMNYVQFYVDPDVGPSDSASNSTTQSKVLSMFDSGSDLAKELAFVAGSGGIDTTDLQNFMDASVQSAADNLIGSSNSISSFFSRILSVSSNVLKGENVVFPEIYQSSEFSRTFSLTVHLKAPYGNKYCYYMDILVPMLHLLAFVLPKQTTANTYGSPFLCKCYVEGIYSCNLGICTSIQINKNVSPESWSVDGFPNEVDVTLNIADLYSHLSMSPQNEPLLFISNSSLIEYLATACGLNLVNPQISTRISFTLKVLQNAFLDIPASVTSEIWDAAEKHLQAWIGIT